jgi:hypothetical protein
LKVILDNRITLNENAGEVRVLEVNMENIQAGKREQPKPQHIGVAIVTTSGSYPAQGFDSVPVHQKVRTQLERAVRELRIADTTNWVAVVGERELNVEASYLDNGLSGEVEIDYGPREGGGGSE